MLIAKPLTARFEDDFDFRYSQVFASIRHSPSTQMPLISET